MRTLKNGLLTGLVLQLAVGPAFFTIVNVAMQKTVFEGLAAVIGVALADYCYITLSILGVGKLLESKKIKKIFGLVSSIVLILFGVFFLSKTQGLSVTSDSAASISGLLTSFSTLFILTISSPLTIVLFTGIFTARALEYNLTKKELIIFGIGTGLATILFMGSTVILFSLIKSSVPLTLIQILNLIVACLLIGYGTLRAIKTIR